MLRQIAAELAVSCKGLADETAAGAIRRWPRTSATRGLLFLNAPPMIRGCQIYCRMLLPQTERREKRFLLHDWLSLTPPRQTRRPYDGTVYPQFWSWFHMLSHYWTQKRYFYLLFMWTRSVIWELIHSVRLLFTNLFPASYPLAQLQSEHLENNMCIWPEASQHHHYALFLAPVATDYCSPAVAPQPFDGKGLEREPEVVFLSQRCELIVSHIIPPQTYIWL